MPARCEANPSRAGDWGPFYRFPSAEKAAWEPSQNWNPLRVVSRRDFLFTLGAVAVIAGLFLPLSTHLLDVLLVLSIFLTAAVLMITFSARRASEASGFPLFIVLATTLRMALSVTSAKLILLHGNAGDIISFFGSIIVRNHVFLAILVFGTLVVLIFGIIYRAANGISHTASDFIADIASIKQLSIDNDLNAGIVSESQALSLREKITSETSFFVAMVGAGRFMLCAAVIELVIVFVNIIASIATGAVGPTATGISPRIYATLTIGAGVVIQISALLAAVASRYLVQKSSADAAANDRVSEQEFTERIKVVAKEVPCPQAEELQDGNTAAAAIGETEEKVITEDLEWFDESQCVENEKDDLSLWSTEDAKDGDYYEAVAELTESETSRAITQAKTILMAAEKVEELGVTIPVNIAIRLAKRGRKCLLIDLDLERDAISKVFDVDNEYPSDKIQAETITKGTPTCISNLWVWSASQYTGIGKGDDNPDAINIKEVITTLQNRYDHLVVYAPNVSTLASADRNRIARCATAAMLFGPEGKTENSTISDFYELLISYGCVILKPSKVFTEAV
jgi:Mrp family chromosome partitioning ATPase